MFPKNSVQHDRMVLVGEDVRVKFICCLETFFYHTVKTLKRWYFPPAHLSLQFKKYQYGIILVGCKGMLSQLKQHCTSDAPSHLKTLTEL